MSKDVSEELKDVVNSDNSVNSVNNIFNIRHIKVHTPFRLMEFRKKDENNSYMICFI